MMGCFLENIFLFFKLPTNKLRLNFAFMQAQSHRIHSSNHGNLVLATTRGVLS